MKKPLIDLSDRSDMFYWQTDRQVDARQTKEIFLDRHHNFDKSMIKAAIEYGMRQYGLTEKESSVVKLHDVIAFGSVNVVMKATLKNGMDVIIRAHPPEVKNGYFWAESLVSQKVKAIGVPTYSTYYIDDSRKKFDFDYLLIECMPGKTMQSFWPIKQDTERKLLKETGEYLAKIHSVRTDGYGYYDNNIAKEEKNLKGIHSTLKDHVFAAFNKNLDYLTENEVISADDRKVIEEIFNKNENLIYCSDPVIIQNDLADWNELSDGKNITGIIDWDESFSGDPVMDFSAWSVFFPFERMKHLVMGYTEISRLPDGYEEKLHLYRIRYIVSKCTTRKKRVVFEPNNKYQQMLDYAIGALKDEFKWYGI